MSKENKLLRAKLEALVYEKCAQHIDTDEIVKDPEVIELAMQLGWHEKAFNAYLIQEVRTIVQSWVDEDTGQRTMVSVATQLEIPAVATFKVKPKRHYESVTDVMGNATIWRHTLKYFFDRLRGLIRKCPLLTNETRDRLLKCADDCQEVEMKRVA